MSEATYQEQVLSLATAWRLFPCKDKKPLTPHGLKDASQDQAQVREWWERWPDAQIGVPVGANTGSFVLDVDLPDGPAALAALEAEHGTLPPTWTARTKSGGEHRHFILPKGLELKNSARALGAGLDIRTEGGYVIAPPTPGYVWTSGQTPRADAPAWLLALLTTPRQHKPAPAIQNASTTPYGRKALEAEASKVALAPEGTRNQTFNSAAYCIGQLVAGGQIDRGEGESTLLLAAS
ncbi:MAG: bifunctional DNA primase/polymerase, partial [Humidesulfovibrio sp.]|nr:bifunctional DNA primase/polymerase [Humidesulfovibrio sp.]